MTILETVRERAVAMWGKKGLLDENVTVAAGPLTAEQAIGTPDDKDFPVLKGKEKLMEAGFRNSRGQAFTDHYGPYSGRLSDVAALPLKDNFERAVFVATLNAVMRNLGLARQTVHCRDQDPTTCAAGMPEFIKRNYGPRRITLVGFQPAMIEALNTAFELRVLDLDPDNVGQVKRGVLIEGPDAAEDALRWADMLAVTGTTLANASIDEFLERKPILFYGTTIAGAAEIMGWPRYCLKAS